MEQEAHEGSVNGDGSDGVSGDGGGGGIRRRLPVLVIDPQSSPPRDGPTLRGRPETGSQKKRRICSERTNCRAAVAAFILIVAASLLPAGTGTHGQAAALIGPRAQIESVPINATVYGLNETIKTTCSCLTPNADFTCCERTFRPSHKMGFYAALSLVRQLEQVYGKNIITMQQGFRNVERPNFGRPEGAVDYRDVVVTRNIYSALASGYLYHRTGRECWLSTHGKPWPHRVGNLWQYEEYMSGTIVPDPPNRNRSLCEYLANESEEAGLKVYIDWSFNVYYKKVLEHWEYAHSSRERRSKVTFVCFEKLTGKEDDLNELLRQAYDLFFPSGGLRVRIKPMKEQKAGGHATSRDPELRNRLQTLVEKYDKEYFNGMVANFQSKFECG